MIDRLNPVAVLRGHWAGLRNRDGDASTPDVWARAVLVVLPGLLAVSSYYFCLQLVEPGLFVSALSLLSAGLLASFAQIASIRSRYVVPDDPLFDDERDTRDMLDESVAHVLTAALLSVTIAVVIVLGMNFNSTEVAGQSLRLGRFTSAVVSGLGTYLVLLFVMTVRKLYGAYVVANEVSRELSGHHN